MPTLQGGWAGMIPFFATSSCGCWVYNLPVLTNGSTGPEAWTLTHTTNTYHNQTDFPVFTDYYLVNGPGSTEFEWASIQRPGCTGYTATFEIFDIPASVPAAMLAYWATYVTTTSPAPYVAEASWTWVWCDVEIEIILRGVYYWPLNIVPPHYSFSTSWRISEWAGLGGGLPPGTPDFALVPYDYVVGTEDTMTGINHPIAGVYTITNAELTVGTVYFQGSTGVGTVEDVIGPLTFLRPDCPPLDACATWIYQWPSLTNRGNVPDYPLTETAFETTGPGTPLHLVPYTQRVYSTLDTGIFYSVANPRSCAYQTTTLTIAQIPASLVAAIAAQAHAEGTALGSVSGYVMGATWQLHWNEIDVLIQFIVTSNFTGTIFSPGPRTITYQMAWDLTVHGTTIETTSGSLVETTTHPFAGTYTYSDAVVGAPEIGNSYVVSSSDVARMGDVFSYASIVTHDTP